MVKRDESRSYIRGVLENICLIHENCQYLDFPPAISRHRGWKAINVQTYCFHTETLARGGDAVDFSVFKLMAPVTPSKVKGRYIGRRILRCWRNGSIFSCRHTLITDDEREFIKERFKEKRKKTRFRSRKR